MLSWQDSETRPGKFVIFNAIHYNWKKKILKLIAFMKPDHGRWDSYPGIGEEKKIIFIKKLTQLFTPLFFLLNIQKQHTESIYMSSFRM